MSDWKFIVRTRSSHPDYDLDLEFNEFVEFEKCLEKLFNDDTSFSVNKIAATNVSKNQEYDIRSLSALNNLRDMFERGHWKIEDSSKIKDISKAINPKHHKKFIDDYDWIDVKIRQPEFIANPEAAELLIKTLGIKYFDRAGRKDDTLQEYMKGLWYLKYLCAFIKNGSKPIKASDVDKILEV